VFDEVVSQQDNLTTVTQSILAYYILLVLGACPSDTLVLYPFDVIYVEQGCQIERGSLLEKIHFPMLGIHLKSSTKLQSSQNDAALSFCYSYSKIALTVAKLMTQVTMVRGVKY
jgi:hypothetical protein